MASKAEKQFSELLGFSEPKPKKQYHSAKECEQLAKAKGVEITFNWYGPRKHKLRISEEEVLCSEGNNNLFYDLLTLPWEPEEAVKSFENWEAFIMTIPEEQFFDLPDFYYKSVKIDQELDGSYSWTLEHNYDFCKMTGWRFPLVGGTNNVQFFKTSKGARRNLIKATKRLFKK